jgi:hypothetical protein
MGIFSLHTIFSEDNTYYEICINKYMVYKLDAREVLSKLNTEFSCRNYLRELKRLFIIYATIESRNNDNDDNSYTYSYIYSYSDFDKFIINADLKFEQDKIFPIQFTIRWKIYTCYYDENSINLYSNDFDNIDTTITDMPFNEGDSCDEIFSKTIEMIKKLIN